MNMYTKSGIGWGSDPEFPVGDWQYEVSNDETRQGYWEWVEQKKDEEEAEREHDLSSCGDA